MPITEQELETLLYEYQSDDQDGLVVRRLVEEIQRLNELHQDALRQIKLVQQKADREIARTK